MRKRERRTKRRKEPRDITKGIKGSVEWKKRK